MNMKQFFYTMMLMLLSVQTGLAADFNMWVGESGSYEMSGTGYYGFKLTRVSCAQPSISCNTVGWVAKWTITQYFSGTATIVIEYSYRVTNKDNWKDDRLTLSVSCKDNQVTLEPSHLELNPGQSYDIDYRFQSRQYLSHPKLHWYTNDNTGKIITVDSSGRVTAKGPGTAYVYLDHDQGSNTGICEVTVKSNDPSSVSIDQSLSLEVGQSKSLTPTLYPSNASTTYSWWSDNNSIASVYNGNVTGEGVGNTYIHVETANGKKASCYVTVRKPSFKVSSTTPNNSATNVSVLTKPSVTFTSQPKWASGKSGNDITLTNVDKSSKVEGTVSLSGKSLIFTPKKALDPQTKYSLTIPANTLIDTYNTKFESAYTLNFKTGNRVKITLSFSPAEEWVVEGTKVSINSNASSSTIYYTTNGTNPTTSSTRYSSAITINRNTTIKAFAICDGYENSDIVSKTYKIPTLKVINTTPKQGEEAGREARPSVAYNSQIKESSNYSKIALSCDGKVVRCDFIINDKQIVCVPQSQLLGRSYTLLIPSDAIISEDGEPNTQYSMSFSIITPPTYIIKGEWSGEDYAGVLNSRGSLLLWGKTGYPSTYTFNPEIKAEDVVDFSGGLYHLGIIKTDHSLWMIGKNDYGQLSDAANSISSSFIKIMDEVKQVVANGYNTFVVKQDNTLWAFGANNRGTLGNGTLDIIYSPEKIMDKVKYVATAGDGMGTLAITIDGKLYIWGSKSYLKSNKPVFVTDNVLQADVCGDEICFVKNDNTLWYNYGSGKSDWSPQKIASNVVKAGFSGPYVDQSKEIHSGMFLKTDGSLWAWGNNSYGLLCQSNLSLKSSVNNPVQIMSNVSDFFLVSDHNYYGVLKQDFSVWTWGFNRGYLNKNYSTLGYYTLERINPEPRQIISSPNDMVSLSQIKLEETSVNITKGSNFALKPVLTPSNAVCSSLAWSSDKPSVAEVNDRGIVTAKAIGTAVITVTVDNKKATCIVTVTNQKKEKLQLSASPNGSEVDKGTIVTLTTKTTSGTAVSGASIHYTLNGSMPTTSSTIYTSTGITINESCTLKAIAFKDGYETSDILTEEYNVTIPDNYVSIGNGTLSENYLFKRETEVEILQNPKKRNYFKVLRPYDGISNDNKNFDYYGSKELEIIIMGPGWNLYNIPITTNDIVYFYSINTGYFYSKYNSYIDMHHPVVFSSCQSEDYWLYNKVLSYQKNGLPEKIQLAPFYYIEDVGGWDMSQEDNVIIITFPKTSSAIQRVEMDNQRENRIFDLYGRQLDKPRKGINIIGGKKVIVR